MRDFVYGDDVIVKAYKDTDYYPFACVEEMTITKRAAILPSSVPDSGAWEDYKYSGKGGWEVSLNGVLVLKDDINTLWFSLDTFLLQAQTTGLDLKFEWTDKNGFLQYATGRALIPESGNNIKSADFARWNLRLQGTGPLDMNGILIAPVNPKYMRPEWIATGAEPNIVQDNRLIGVTKDQIGIVSWEGNDVFKVIDAGNPTEKQVRLDNAAGTLRFKNNLEPGDFIWCRIDL